MTTNTRVITGPHFITTSPTAVRCNRCPASVLAATVGGIDRHIDPTPLTLAGELAALLAGRATYDLRGDHLIRRDVHRINAGGRRLPVLADHTCRPADPHHVDHAHLEVAVRLVRDLLGGQVVTTTPDEKAPF